MPRPPRLRSHVLWAAFAVLVVAVFWITWSLMAPPLEPSPVRAARVPKLAKPPVPTVASVSPVKAPELPDPMSIDPEIQRMADDLSAKTESPARDLEIVGEFIELYRKVFQQGNPIGLNEDITSVLTGHNARNGILFPPGSPMIVKGKLVDRWGTPYWFHPNNSFQMEIRSAGPDRDLFTHDDIVANPGPDNMGIGTAQASKN